MTWPLFAGSALNAASWASPTVSKVKPTAQDSTPSTVTTIDSAPSANPYWPSWTGSDTTHMITRLRQVDLADHVQHRVARRPRP